MGLGEVGPEADGFLAGLDPRLELPLAEEDGAQAIVRIGEIRPHANRVAEVGDRLVLVARLLQGQRQDVMGLEAVGSKREARR